MKVSIGPMMLLFMLFLTLKLCKVITWSWLWVFAPLWGTLAIGILIFVIAFIITVVLE